jgi:hypothetical protein
LRKNDSSMVDKVFDPAELYGRNHIMMGEMAARRRAPHVDAVAVGHEEENVLAPQGTFDFEDSQVIIARQQNWRVPIRFSYFYQPCFLGKRQKPEDRLQYVKKPEFQSIHQARSRSFLAAKIKRF